MPSRNRCERRAYKVLNLEGGEVCIYRENLEDSKLFDWLNPLSFTPCKSSLLPFI
jgi:hypothetical protein